MLTEMLGKGGRVCQPAREGKLKCPLIVRPTSEDVITGQLFGTLRAINPRWWLPDLLNQALGTQRFPTQVYRNFKIDLWQNQPNYPRRLLPWKEGSTQVDVIITWQNPPTTVFIEMKYLAELSAQTKGDDGRHGYPSDQLIRNIRVGLLGCRWFQSPGLFEMPSRDFIQLVISPQGEKNLIDRYRNMDQLTASIPKSEQLAGLPRQPFVGQLSYRELAHLLQDNRRFLTRAERILVDHLSNYLLFKLGGRGGGETSLTQQEFPPG